MYLAKKLAALKLQSLWRGSICRLKYLASLSAIVKIQSVIFRRCIALKKHNAILQKRCSSIVAVQSSFRCYTQRKRFEAKRCAAICIQAFMRRYFTRQVLRSTFSAVIIQSSYRKWRAIKIFSAFQSCAIKIQSRIRCLQNRTWFIRARQASSKITAYQRKRVAMRKYNSYKSAVTCLQSAYRSKAALLIVQKLKEYQTQQIAQTYAMQTAAKKIQISFRRFLLRCEKNVSAHIIQTFWRKYSMKRQNCLILLKLGKIQAFWRGCLSRSRTHTQQKLVKIRSRVALANKNARSDMTLGQRTRNALQVLMCSKNLSDVFAAIKTLEVSTRLSSVCCTSFVGEADEAVPIIYGLMRSCNRSQPHRKLLLHALRVLSNVWPYEMGLIFKKSIQERKESRRLVPAFAPRMEILVDLMQVSFVKPKISAFFLSVVYITILTSNSVMKIQISKLK